MSPARFAIAFSLALVAGASLARADTFGGFSGVDRSYLVNQDRVCTPIVVAGGTAAGAPTCERAAADQVARLSIKPPVVQAGPRAGLAATASGRTLRVARKTGGALVAWDAPDPIVKIVELYASQYEDRVAVAYVVRRAGKDVTDVIAFDLGQAQTGVKPATDPTTASARPSGATGSPVSGIGATPPPPATPAPEDPKVVKAVAAARAAAQGKALAAWKAVLVLDAALPEALFQIAAGELAAKHTADAIAALVKLSESARGDALEWLVEARFAPAFAALRADPTFRGAVGLDRKPATMYERLMGFGGHWEQTGTSCDRPEVRFTAGRDRSFKLRVKTTCEGTVYDTSFKGTWRFDADRLVLVLPNTGRQSTAADEASCGFEPAGDEEALRCALGRDLDFVVLPTRR